MGVTSLSYLSAPDSYYWQGVRCFDQSSSYHGAPFHGGFCLVRGQWVPARFEGATPEDAAQTAWMLRNSLSQGEREPVAVLINGTIFTAPYLPKKPDLRLGRRP